MHQMGLVLVAQGSCHMVVLEYNRYIHQPVGGLVNCSHLMPLSAEVPSNVIAALWSAELLVSGRF